MVIRIAAALALACVAAAPAAAAEPHPFTGVFSILRADFEKHYEMTKFLCLTSFSVQNDDGSYTGYHADTGHLKQGKISFHPYETGVCTYTAASRTEHCKVTKSNWGEYVYYIEHRGEADGAHVQASVDMRNPSQATVSNVRRCPFDAAQIKPFLSQEWLHISDDDMDWLVYRQLPFNPDQAKQIRKLVGIAE